MRVGWLQDTPSYVGGAEMTAAEFRNAKPDGVEIVDCPPGEVVSGLDCYVVQNCVHYSVHDFEQTAGAVVKYANDVMPHGQPGAKQWLEDNAEWIFCSPLQREKMQLDGVCVPPPVDVDRFKPPRQARKQPRGGTCSVAQWRNPGKGAQYIEDYARSNGGVDVYGPGTFHPQGKGVRHCGEVEPVRLPQTLWQYESFVFLPFEIEPFCRTVVEAYAAGCEVITNDLIGARHYLENDMGALETAAQDFWEVVCG